MARLARIAIGNVPHHVTQRGNAGQFLLAQTAEKAVYLELLQKYLDLYRVSLLGYCLMSNHVHLIVLPTDAEALALALKQTHGRFASFWNGSHCSSGHVWQGRFYSCPLDEAHLWMALRYTERNPVRARLVKKPEDWEWSSARMHCGEVEAPAWLRMEKFGRRWSAAAWREYLLEGESESDLREVRRSTHTGRPLGSGEFLRQIEQATNRSLVVSKGGRPRGSMAEGEEARMDFAGGK
jgi:putative transposase